MLMAHRDPSAQHRHHMPAEAYHQPAAIRNNWNDADHPRDLAKSVVRE